MIQSVSGLYSYQGLIALAKARRDERTTGQPIDSNKLRFGSDSQTLPHKPRKP